jgi:hypothetical protein
LGRPQDPKAWPIHNWRAWGNASRRGRRKAPIFISHGFRAFPSRPRLSALPTRPNASHALVRTVNSASGASFLLPAGNRMHHKGPRSISLRCKLIEEISFIVSFLTFQPVLRILPILRLLQSPLSNNLNIVILTKSYIIVLVTANSIIRQDPIWAEEAGKTVIASIAVGDDLFHATSGLALGTPVHWTLGLLGLWEWHEGKRPCVGGPNGSRLLGACRC